MPFPVGIAAGLDKMQKLIDYFGRLGVGGLEVGTVTPRAQEGVPKPQTFPNAEERNLYVIVWALMDLEQLRSWTILK